MGDETRRHGLTAFVALLSCGGNEEHSTSKLRCKVQRLIE
jgi:hypothetical protein